MPDPRQDFRATTESIRRDAEQVVALEEQKQELDPGDPRVDHLSAQVERITAGLQDKVAAERELAEEIKAER